MRALQALAHRLERLANGERGVHGTQRSVLVRHRRAEQRHQAIARELIHHAFHAVDLGKDDVEILLEQVVVLLGIEALGDADRAHEIAEEHRDELALAGDRREARDRLRRRTGPAACEDARERIPRRRREIVVVLG